MPWQLQPGKDKDWKGHTAIVDCKKVDE